MFSDSWKIEVLICVQSFSYPIFRELLHALNFINDGSDPSHVNFPGAQYRHRPNPAIFQNVFLNIFNIIRSFHGFESLRSRGIRGGESPGFSWATQI
jgi:hypothetical protein